MKYLSFITLLGAVIFAQPVHAQSITIYEAQEAVSGGVNSPYFEENPILHPSGDQLYFTRTSHPGNIGGRSDKGDVWMSERSDAGDWSAPVNLGTPLNSDGLNALIGFANSGNEMYMSVDYRDNDGIVRKGVAVSRKNGQTWTAPSLVSIQYFSNKSDHQSGWITADGSILLLSIEAPGGYGTEDLYVCFRQQGDTWSSPRNLGFAINTAYQETTPFLAEDKKTLVFSTNGIAGLGGRDLFMSERQDDSWRSWSVPVSLGDKVNTSGTELSFSFLQGDDFAYLTSTQNSEGYSDIKRVKIKADIVEESLDSIPQTPLIAAVVPLDAVPPNDPEELTDAPEVLMTAVSGTVRNAKTLAPLAASITVTGQANNIISNLQANEAGQFAVSLTSGQSFTLTVSAPGYLEEQLMVETFDRDEVNESVLLQPLSVGNTVTLSHVLFEQSTADMIRGSEADLDRVAKMLDENPDVEILISGHTDNQGPIKPNIKLSESRVQTVIDYLLSKGVDKGRLTGKGYGPTKPIASNASEETRQLNRRVEFTITKGGN